MLYINRYSHIRDQTLIRQGVPVITQPDGTLNDLLSLAFARLEIAYPKFYKMDRLSQLGFLASELILHDKSILQGYSSEQVALVLSSAHGSQDADERYNTASKTIASPALFVYTLPNIVAGEICIRQGIRGENAFFITPQFDPVLLADYLSMVMASGKTQACLAGWADVLGEQHDVFLYLVEKTKGPDGVAHSAAELQHLYSRNYGTIDG